MKRKRILFLSPYPVGCAPSQRLKYEQYYHKLEQDGYEITTSSFVSENFWKILYLKGNFFVKAIYTILGYFRRIKDLFRLSEFDVVYVHLWVTPVGPPVFEYLVRLLSKRLVYDIDDMVFLGHSSAANQFFQFLKGKNKMISLMKNSDHVITCTPTLDSFVKKYNYNTTDISSTINTDIYQPQYRNINNKSTIVLGWSGSHSTSKYLHLLDDVIREISRHYPIELKVIGDENFDISGVKVNAVPWNESNEVEELSEIDIGLYPLPDEPWVYGKSGLKALQYMALGIPTIATAIGANFRVVDKDKTGLLIEPNDYEGWFEAVKKLIEDNEMYSRFSCESSKRVEQIYSIRANTSKYIRVLNRRIRTSILINSLDRGGAEKIASLLADQFDPSSVEFVLLEKQINQDVPQNIGIRFLRAGDNKVSLLKFLTLIPAAINYRRFLKRNKVEKSISFLNRPNFINVLATLSVHTTKTYINERSYPPEAYKLKSAVNLSTMFLIRILYPLADLVVCNSLLTTNYFKRIFSTNTTLKIHYWRNPIYSLPDSEIINSKKSKYSNVLNIITVGRLDKNKNQKLLLSALSEIRFDFSLDIIGKGEELDSLKEFVRRRGMKNVFFNGQLKYVSGFYRNADVFVLCSFFEGYPNVVLEAMQYGVPVISADCKSGPREIFGISNDLEITSPYYSDYGVLVPVNDMFALKEALNYVRDNKPYRQLLSGNSIKRIKEFEQTNDFSLFAN